MRQNTQQSAKSSLRNINDNSKSIKNSSGEDSVDCDRSEMTE